MPNIAVKRGDQVLFFYKEQLRRGRSVDSVAAGDLVPHLRGDHPASYIVFPQLGEEGDVGLSQSGCTFSYNHYHHHRPGRV